MYSTSGEAIMKCYEFDPHRISASTVSRVLNRLRQHSRILRSSVERLLAQAQASATATPAGGCHEISLEHLRVAWTDYRTSVQITHKGRPQLRRVTMQMILPLVRRGELFGDYYAQKTTVQKMPGPKAMTAVARKFIKMIWGWSHAEGAAFDAERVFRAQSARSQAA